MGQGRRAAVQGVTEHMHVYCVLDSAQCVQHVMTVDNHCPVV